MGPLNGYRMLDFTEVGPGPFCAMMLSDMGAEVLRVDRASPAELGWKRDPRFNFTKRNRQSIALDLKHEDGKATALRLIEGADAIIEGFRPGVMERLGLGPQECLARNPKLVYGRLTGWGQDGPLAQEVGHDMNFLSITGVLNTIGYPDRPPVPPLSMLGDYAGGGLHLAFGIACALIEVQNSGKGQVIDAAIVDGVLSLATPIYGFHAGGYWKEERYSNPSDGGAPFNSVYETSDGKYVTIAAIEPRFYRELLKRLGLEESSLPPQNERSRWPELRRHFRETFKGRTAAEWIEVMKGGDVCFAPVLDFNHALHHPHLTDRGSFVEVDGMMHPAPAPRLSRTRAAIRSGPVNAGANTVEALGKWGFSQDEIDSLIASKAVIQA